MARFNWKQRILFFPPVVLGAVILLLAPAMQAEPPKAADTTGKKVVRVIKVAPRKLQPSVVGYGHTRPQQQWLAQSELEGVVVWESDLFKAGAIVEQGSELMRLDPSSYQLAIARLEAELDVLVLSAESLRASLSIAEQEYQVQRSEYDRSMRLSKTGHISQAEKDKATRDLLSSRQQLQGQKNSLTINQAQQKVLNTELAQARRDLELTVIRAPFDIRITEKLVGLAEYVNKGEMLLKADGIAAVEVSAQFPLGKMQPLRRNTAASALDNALHANLEAVVELQAGDRVISWPASVSRSGGLVDAQTQSQSIVVQITQPYKQAVPGRKPPLVRDTFVRVTLKAPVLKHQILLPVSALHGDKVYLVRDGKLHITPVEVDFVQGQVAVIKTGLVKDDLVVLSKLAPAVEGMSLKPEPDKQIVKWLERETGFAAGKSSQDQAQQSEAK